MKAISPTDSHLHYLINSKNFAPKQDWEKLKHSNNPKLSNFTQVKHQNDKSFFKCLYIHYEIIELKYT